MKSKLLSILLALWVGSVLLAACSNNKEDAGVLGGCPMNTNPGIQGDMVVLAEIEAAALDLWRTYQADYCYYEPLLGTVRGGEDGLWHKVKENHDGALMVLVTISEGGSGVETLGWLDCHYVEITSTLDGRPLTDDETACSELQ